MAARRAAAGWCLAALACAVGATSCELRPPPPPAPVAVVAPPADAGAVASCAEVGERVAVMLVSTAPDDATRGIYEQERANVVRRTTEVCIADAWSAAARRCFLDAATREALQACGQDLAAPAVPTLD